MSSRVLGWVTNPHLLWGPLVSCTSELLLPFVSMPERAARRAGSMGLCMLWLFEDEGPC